MVGRHMKIPTIVNRVATNIAGIPPTIYLLGGISKLVFGPLPSYNPLLTSIDPAIKNIPSSPATTINAEELVAAHPQVFFVSTFTQGLLPILTRLGIPYVEITSSKSPAQYKSEINLIGDVLGGTAPARAKQYDTYYDNNVQMIQTKTASLPQSNKPEVYVAAGPDPTKTVGLDNLINAAIEVSGGRNIAAEHGITYPGGLALPSITAEQLVTWNPQIIVATSPKIQQQLMSDPKYGTLNAVRNRRIYTYPTEPALVPLSFARNIHPELFPALDLATAVKDFYSKFYSYQPSDQQISAILNGSLG